jgi:peptidoglycan/LPS O-acetylase OafA/YrhL
LTFGGFYPIGFVGYAYVILFVCFQPPGWAGRLANRHDISFGVYLYAFPIQLLLTAGGVPKLGVLAYVGITVALTVPLALVSWLAVERPALRLKDRGPGRIGRRVPGSPPLSMPEPATEVR